MVTGRHRVVNTQLLHESTENTAVELPSSVRCHFLGHSIATDPLLDECCRHCAGCNLLQRDYFWPPREAVDDRETIPVVMESGVVSSLDYEFSRRGLVFTKYSLMAYG